MTKRPVALHGAGRFLWAAVVGLGLLQVMGSPRADADGGDADNERCLRNGARRVLVGRLLGLGFSLYEEIALVGTWDRRSGWQNAEWADFPRLLPNGGDWTLYRLSGPPIQVASEPPYRVVDEHGWEWFPSKLRKPTGHEPGAWLAVSGAKTVDKRSVRLLANVEDPCVAAIRQQLESLGFWKRPTAKLWRNIAVDFNGDGREDRVLTVSKGMGEILPEGAEHGYWIDLIVAAAAREDGMFDLAVLTEKSWERMQKIGGFLAARVVAVADIDGDGLSEIATGVYTNDYAAFEVHAQTKEGFRPALLSQW